LLFDKGEGLSEDSAPFDAMHIALEDQMEVTIGGDFYLMSMGEMIVLPARVPLAVKAISRFKMMLVMIHAYIRSFRT
jgi:quercetin dioxygenase-like cupin family protein